MGDFTALVLRAYFPPPSPSPSFGQAWWPPLPPGGCNGWAAQGQTHGDADSPSGTAATPTSETPALGGGGGQFQGAPSLLVCGWPLTVTSHAR